MLKGKRILLGITGGIAAYKAVEIVSRLRKLHAEVKVIMTDAAKEFVTPLTFQTMSGNVVHNEMFNQLYNMDVEHISLAKWADLILVAPASANTIAKIRYGIADNMLTTVLLARRCPLVLAPAMNTVMYEQSINKENILHLQNNGVYFLEPGEGLLACGDTGAGKMMDPIDIIERLEMIVSKKDLEGKNIAITAGPTKERFDPVRFVSNHSSGKMGYALAEAARNRGANVTLISGPTNLKKPWGIDFVQVESTQDMFKAVENCFDKIDILIKAAAPSDFRPAEYKEEKIKKSGKETLSIELQPNPDIAKHFGKIKKNQTIVGFAAESHNLEEHAKRKMQEKGFDFIVANNITQEGAGFNSDTNIVEIFESNGKKHSIPQIPKTELAEVILDLVKERVKS